MEKEDIVKNKKTRTTKPFSLELSPEHEKALRDTAALLTIQRNKKISMADVVREGVMIMRNQASPTSE